MYSQICLLKIAQKPRTVRNTTLFTRFVASACYILRPTLLSEDMP